MNLILISLQIHSLAETPPLFIITQESVATDTILPPTSCQFLDLDFVITTRSRLHTNKADEESEMLLHQVKETGRNSLIFGALAKFMEDKGFVVKENKSVMLKGEITSSVSVCSTTQPDLALFNPHRSVMLFVEEVDDMEADEDFIAEAEVKKKKGLQGFTTENKNVHDNDANFQQLLGGVEKVMGELSLQYVKNTILEPEEAMFTYIDIYAFSVYHKSDICVVRKVEVDFDSEKSVVLLGKTVLGKNDAFNRVSALLTK